MTSVPDRTANAGRSLIRGPLWRRSAFRSAMGGWRAFVLRERFSRERPDRAGAGVPVWRNVRMPTSTSFPSGHAASGFAFAAAIGRDQPWLGLGLRFLRSGAEDLATGVACRRTRTLRFYAGGPAELRSLHARFADAEAVCHRFSVVGGGRVIGTGRELGIKPRSV